MIKALVQKLFSFLPLGEKVNTLASSLRGGNSMEIIETRTLNLARKLGRLGIYKDLEGAVVLEVGVGWLPIAPMLFFLLGAEKTIGIDRFKLIRSDKVAMIAANLSARSDMLKNLLPVKGEILERRLAILSEIDSLEKLQKNLKFHYLAPGDARATGLGPNSIDLVFSYGVLEHLSPRDLRELSAEQRRILRQKGLVYHWINLQDHYRNIDKSLSGVNFLQYGEKFWATFIDSSIHYQNRLRKPDYIKLFEASGGSILHSEHLLRESDLCMLQIMKIDRRFDHYSKTDLAVWSLDVFLGYE
jgi:hypothetical protein